MPLVGWTVPCRAASPHSSTIANRGRRAITRMENSPRIGTLISCARPHRDLVVGMVVGSPRGPERAFYPALPAWPVGGEHLGVAARPTPQQVLYCAFILGSLMACRGRMCSHIVCKFAEQSLQHTRAAATVQDDMGSQGLVVAAMHTIESGGHQMWQV